MPTQAAVADEKRFVIRAKSPEYRQEIKKLYGSGIGRAQVHRILNITKGDIVGLKVGRHADDSKKIWFTYRGHRYDVKPDGTLGASVAIAKPAVVPSQVQKKVKCHLCGQDTPMVRFDVMAKCPNCGFRLVTCKVVRWRTK